MFRCVRVGLAASIRSVAVHRVHPQFSQNEPEHRRRSPYERPPLSKGFLAGKDTEASIFISAEDFYRTHGIEVRLDCVADRVDPAQKRVHLRSGEEIGFGKLVVATGAQVRKLDIPGSSLDGVYYLRSLEDSKRIRQNAESAKRVVVIGGVSLQWK